MRRAFNDEKYKLFAMCDGDLVVGQPLPRDHHRAAAAAAARLASS